MTRQGEVFHVDYGGDTESLPPRTPECRRTLRCPSWALCSDVTANTGDMRPGPNTNGLKASFCVCPHQEFPPQPGALHWHHRGCKFFFTQTLENPSHVPVATQCPANRSDQMTSIRSSLETGDPVVSKDYLGHKSAIIFIKDFIPTF